jgi:hypothetical protein
MTEDESNRNPPERCKMTPQMQARCKISLGADIPRVHRDMHLPVL